MMLFIMTFVIMIGYIIYNYALDADRILIETVRKFVALKTLFKPKRSILDALGPGHRFWPNPGAHVLLAVARV